MKTVVFCLPGNTFSGKFLEAWTDLLVYALRSEVEVFVRRKYTSNVFLARNIILKDPDPELATEDMKEMHDVMVPPLGGMVYDYLFWIDSDMTFRPKQFRQLIEHDEAIVSGVAICGDKGKVNAGYIEEDGNLHFYTVNELLDAPTDEKGLVDVDFCGYAWLAIKKGVFESMPYPWFRPILVTRGKKTHFPSEDLGWCITAKEKGWSIKVDPWIWIGHEKSLVLHPANSLDKKHRELMKNHGGI